MSTACIGAFIKLRSERRRITRASYFGGSDDDYDVMKSGLSDVGGTEVAAGNDTAWHQLFTDAQALAANPTANANLVLDDARLESRRNSQSEFAGALDVDNLVDYMAIIFYTGGFDTGLSQFLGNNQANNWFGIYNHTTADQGFQFFIHDNEHSLGRRSERRPRFAEHRPHRTIQ